MVQIEQSCTDEAEMSKSTDFKRPHINIFFSFAKCLLYFIIEYVHIQCQLLSKTKVRARVACVWLRIPQNLLHKAYLSRMRDVLKLFSSFVSTTFIIYSKITQIQIVRLKYVTRKNTRDI